MTLAEFLDYLARAVSELAHLDEPHPDWVAFRRHCETREEVGRQTFGDAWKTRDNAAEGLEEAADGLMYAYFAAERARLEGDDYEAALQLAVIASRHFFLAHQALAELRSPTS